MTAASDARLKGEIERIVRDVLARMSADVVENGDRTNKNGDAFSIPDRVVTVATLERRVNQKTTVVVRHDAIITPAARDLLRAANAMIERSGRPIAGAQLGLTWVVGVAETAFDPTSVLVDVTRVVGQCEQLARVGLVGVVDELVERVSRDGAVGLLFTDMADAALALANRQRGVRAVLARSATAARQARQTIAANLFVIEPEGRSVFDLKQTIAATKQPAGYACSDECRTRLA